MALCCHPVELCRRAGWTTGQTPPIPLVLALIEKMDADVAKRLVGEKLETDGTYRLTGVRSKSKAPRSNTQVTGGVGKQDKGGKQVAVEDGGPSKKKASPKKAAAASGSVEVAPAPSLHRHRRRRGHPTGRRMLRGGRSQ